MGTCIGLRNIRYFVSFLSFTSLHALITLGISAAYFFNETNSILDQVLGNKNKKREIVEEEEVEAISSFMRAVHIYNCVVVLWSFVFFAMLACFACSMFDQVMNNVTTNENLRKKWNAKNVDERNKSQ